MCQNFVHRGSTKFKRKSSNILHLNASMGWHWLQSSTVSTLLLNESKWCCLPDKRVTEISFAVFPMPWLLVIPTFLRVTGDRITVHKVTPSNPVMWLLVLSFIYPQYSVLYIFIPFAPPKFTTTIPTRGGHRGKVKWESDRPHGLGMITSDPRVFRLKPSESDLYIL